MLNNTILIVDDSQGDLDILVELLGRDYNVRVAMDGESALRAIDVNPPDLVLLDVMMPGMDGYAVCEKLKASFKTSGIPVIFISALKATSDKVKGFEVGGLDYIPKPFQPEEVFARVKTHMLLRSMQQELELNNLELTRLASLDGLTQIANRRIFDERFEKEWRRACRISESLTLIICDIDYFKLYNDCYGHQAGDDCLKLVAKAISQTMRRPMDLTARYGGEEFTVMLPGTDKDGAAKMVQEIQTSISNLAIPHEKSAVNDFVTLSLGGCSMMPTTKNSAAQLLKAADLALYQAKELGRNRYIARSFYL